MRNRLLGGVAAIGVAGLLLIQVSEGKVNRVYPDAVGKLTACYGHTGPELRLGQTFTDDQCDEMLDKDIAVHTAGVRACTFVPLNQNQLAAVVSLTFNIGVWAYCNSTLNRRLNALDYTGAAAEFPKWNKATIKGVRRPLTGLTVRRWRERRLFLTDPTPEATGAYTASLRALVRT